MNTSEQFVLMSAKGTYFVEFLIGTLVLSDSISEATIFDCPDQAHKFRDYLDENCEMEFSVNTFIPLD
ncbi:hypothetical protein [Maribacter polysaccharolyticus]|uniref:hypothetical protein n=1 Tax=Maribacter polysaccharolyticus TaxID=3020831 RepID=UPI00237EF496|nr:hypothetical protein [Maribacter polysaccharolyticus]MDE3744060.1 hypothetical protein [Maribacter polysaccharolyticus]